MNTRTGRGGAALRSPLGAGGRAVRGALAAGAAVVVAVTLAGCGGLPSTGPVTQGLAVDEAVNEPVRVSAQGPVDGASKEAVVRGFLRAGEDNDETRQAGKSFLTPQSVDLWRWSSQEVVVYSGDLAFREVGADSLEVSARVVARLGTDGHYVEQPPDTRARLVLGLTKVGGEWRIELPATGFGLWLDADQFDRIYTNQNVYYVSRTGRELVPDPRWFPNGSRLATTLARAQLALVPEYLKGAVVSGVPASTRLAVNAVPVENGTAQINLSASALSADPEARARMWAQFTATLTQVSSVRSVSLAVDNTTLELTNGLSSVSSASELGYAVVRRPTFDTALLRVGDAISRIDPRFVPDTASTSRRPDTKPQDTDVARIPDSWGSLALSGDGKQVAAVSGSRADLSIWRATDPVRVLRPFAGSLTRPVYDATGYLWVGGADARGTDRMYAFDSVSKDPEAAPKAVTAPWLTGRRIRAVAAAPEGDRLLVVTTATDGSDSRLSLTGVVRSSTGEPTALATPRQEAQALTQIQDVTWVDSTTYAVLGQQRAAEPVRPWLGTIGAGLDGVRRGSPLAAVPGALTITTVDGPRGLLIVTNDRRVLARAGSTWRNIETGSDVLVPGG